MRRLILLFTLAALGSFAPVRAEKVDLGPNQLRDIATHVVVGKIVAVYERKERKGDWNYTHYLAEVKVDKSEKGDLKAGALAYVRYWTRAHARRGLPPPSTKGHRGLPAAGETKRIYLARNAYDGFSKDNDDGGLNVIGANGFASAG
jgi:hypothetical protein